MLITAGRARYKVDWGLGVDVVMSRHCVVKYWPEAFVGVFMRFNDEIHTVLKKQRLEAGQNTNRKASVNSVYILLDLYNAVDHSCAKSR